MAVELDPIEYYTEDEGIDVQTINRPLLQLQENQVKLNNDLADLKTRLVIVSIDGPSSVTSGDTYTYTITDYDEWSSYTVSATLGIVTQVDANGQFTLDIPVGTPDGSTTVTIDRDTVIRNIVVSIGASGVNTPTITSHTDGQTGVNIGGLTFTTSAFSSYPTGFGELASVDWELYSDSGMTTLVDSKSDATGSLSWSVNSSLVDESATYYLRVKHVMNNSDESDWMQLSFTTTNIFGINPNFSSSRSLLVGYSNGRRLENTGYGTTDTPGKFKTTITSGSSQYVHFYPPLGDGVTSLVRESRISSTRGPSYIVPEFVSYSHKYGYYARMYVSGDSWDGGIYSGISPSSQPLQGIYLRNTSLSSGFIGCVYFLEDIDEIHVVFPYSNALTVRVYDAYSFVLLRTVNISALPMNTSRYSKFYDGRYFCLADNETIYKLDPIAYNVIHTITITHPDAPSFKTGCINGDKFAIVRDSATDYYFDMIIFDNL